MNKKPLSSKRSSPRPDPVADQSKAAPANRVAEPTVAAYTVARPKSAYKRQPSLPRRIAGHEVCDEVWRFAVANDLIPHLETAIRLVHECFPTVRKVDFQYVIDPEIENNSWVTIEIKVSGSVEEVLAQMTRFDDEMIKQVPIEKGTKICLGVGGL